MNESVRGADYPTLRLFGRTGKDAISLSALDSGPGITMFDENGKHRLSMSFEEGEDCQITLFDMAGKSRVSIRIDKSNAAVLESADGDGHVTWSSSK